MTFDSILPFPDPRDAANCFDRKTKQTWLPKCPPDHWLDEALRAVPLPDGFLQRVSLLARAGDADAVDGNRGRADDQIATPSRRPTVF